MEVTI
jgi:uncharacterized membrane protein YecN with MAPEG domain